jgi:hypothetical protein
VKSRLAQEQNIATYAVAPTASSEQRVLYLAVKKKWWDLIVAGAKHDELRLKTPFWERRLIGRTYDAIEITWGYPGRGDASRRLRFAWNGFFVCSILHEEFGDRPVTVFKIGLSTSVTPIKESNHQQSIDAQ